jgi:hypothetical protein
MAQEIEKSGSSLPQRSSDILTLVPASILVACLIAAVVAAFAAQSWVLFSILVAALACAIVVGYLTLGRLSARGADALLRLRWQTASAEIQRQNLSIEVSELARTLETDDGSRGEVFSAYVVAEDLALRQIQQEQRAPMLRHINIGRIPFDAVIFKGNLLLCVEVSFLVVPDIRQEKIDAILRKAAAAKTSVDQQNTGLSLRLLLVVITQLTKEDEVQLRSVLNTSKFAETPVDIDIQFLDFEALQKIYMAD